MRKIMKNIIIVGAGGLAKDLYAFLADRSDIEIKGLLVDVYRDYQNFDAKIPYLGKIRDYQIENGDSFLVAIGENPGRKEVIDYFVKENANFFTFIHPLSIISPTAQIGEGCIIGPFNTIGSEVIIGANTFINKHCNVGHGSIIGTNCILYPYAAVGGNCEIGQDAVLSTRATIAPRVKVGEFSTISAHTFVKKNVEDHTFVYFQNTVKTRRKKICADS